MLKPDSEAWYAQPFKSFLAYYFLAHYDDVVIQTLPMGEKKPVQWLKDLVAAAAHYPEGIKKSVFELQPVNWKALEKIPSPVFIGQLDLLAKRGVHHIGYCQDDVYLDQPRLADLQKYVSLPALP